MGKSQKITPEVVNTIPPEFLPFVRDLVGYLGPYMSQPYPNPYQRGVLGGFFGSGGGPSPDVTLPYTPGPVLPPPGPGGPIGQPGIGGGGYYDRDVLGQDVLGRGLQGPEGRPLFGPPGADPTFGGSRINTALMRYLDRIFPGYSQRAGVAGRTPPEPMAGPWEAIGGRDAPWGGAGGTVGGLMDMRAESAARGVRMDALLDELARQMAGQ